MSRWLMKGCVVVRIICVLESMMLSSRLSGKKSLIRRADIELMMKTKPYERIMPKEDFDIAEYYTAEEIAQKYKVNAKWVWTYTRQHKVPKVEKTVKLTPKKRRKLTP